MKVIRYTKDEVYIKIKRLRKKCRHCKGKFKITVVSVGDLIGRSFEYILGCDEVYPNNLDKIPCYYSHGVKDAIKKITDNPELFE